MSVNGRPVHIIALVISPNFMGDNHLSLRIDTLFLQHKTQKKKKLIFTN